MASSSRPTAQPGEENRTERHRPFRLATACVMGGSFAGLLAARVLADHTEQVVILERDAGTAGSGVRPSVPQGRHGHFMQPELLPLLDGWFPGFVEDARRLGAVLAPPGHYRLFIHGHAAQFPDVTMLMASRPLIENEVRRRVSSLPNVQIVRAQARGLRFRADAVSGVTYIPYGSDDWGPTCVLDVDVAVDAMGKGSRLSHWLAKDGFDTPVVQRVPVGIGYTTAGFTRPADPREPDIACALDQFSTPLTTAFSIYPASNNGPISLAVYAIEANLWQAVAMAYGPRRPGMTVEDIRGICATLDGIFQEATSGEPVGEPASYYYQGSLRRSTATLEHFPTGLFSAGDSLASFNPIHGQGMMSAAIQASTLATHFSVEIDPAGTNRTFSKLSESAVDELWKVAAGI